MPKELTGKIFIWHGVDSNGFKIKKEIHAKNIEEAKAFLLNQKIIVLKIYPKLEIPLLKDNIKQTDITELSVEFSTLISAGIPLSVALNIMIENSRKSSMMQLLNSLKKHIESGHLLSEALRSHKRYFDYFFYTLVYAGF